LGQGDELDVEPAASERQPRAIDHLIPVVDMEDVHVLASERGPRQPHAALDVARQLAKKAA
jgi:hypothetical protein